MNAIVCEMCGSQDLVKQDGMYVCQNCGTKYSVEEAKKLLVTVVVDKSAETQKLLVLARRARDNNDSVNAETYYSKILENDPSDWEAAFFNVYYRSMQCKIINISSAAMDVANCMDSTIRLISELDNDSEKNNSLNTVVKYSVSIATMLASAALDHLKKYTGTSNGVNEYKERVFSASNIYAYLEKALKRYFSDSKQITEVQKHYQNFLRDYRGGFNRTYVDSEYSRLTSEITKTDSTYSAPPAKKSGCYVATSIYGSYDCPQVWTLRRYRDYTLAETWYGRVFIRAYYAISPTLVKWFGNTVWFRNLWKTKLDKMVEILKRNGFDDTPYSDRDW